MILVTGASGFIGKELVRELVKRNEKVRVLSRTPSFSDNLDVDEILISDIAGGSFQKAFNGVTIVFHLASRAHQMKDHSIDSITEYRNVNVLGTINVATQAKKGGVDRFIFLSSIKVNGEFTLPGRFFSPEDKPAPSDSYSISKLEAELSLAKLCADSNMKFVIVRPPLVYGPNAKGNLKQLMKLINSNIPLPFGFLNKTYRSLVGIKNLIDFLALCSKHPNAANQILFVKDKDDLSIRELARKLAWFSKKKAYFFYLPIFVLKFLFMIIGKSHLSNRLLNNLRLDIKKSEDLLGWIPKYSFLDCMNHPSL
jgi:nucleoside-diphosphate-sugar epimerase